MALTVLCLEKKDQNSSAGKQTQDLSIKLGEGRHGFPGSSVGRALEA